MKFCLGISLLVVCFFGSCTYSNEEEVFGVVDPGSGGSPSEVSLASDVVPIINADCAISGCHVAGATFPNLSVKANIISNKTQIRSRTQSGDMPRGGRSLSLAEKNLIRDWVDQGALDN